MQYNVFGYTVDNKGQQCHMQKSAPDKQSAMTIIEMTIGMMDLTFGDQLVYQMTTSNESPTIEVLALCNNELICTIVAVPVNRNMMN